MNKFSLHTLIARYQAGFGYVAGNVAEILANSSWASSINLPLFSDPKQAPGVQEDIPVFSVNDVSFAEVVFTNVKSSNAYRFGSSIEAYGENKQYLAPPLMLSFSRDKHVVRTPIDRSEIEVIEHFGLKPWSIRIQGLLVDIEGHQYPQRMLQKVSEMFAEWGTYKVTGTIFTDLKIFEVFFESNFEIGFVEGYADTVKFSLTAISTAPTDAKAVGF